jgi:hypothetical protein
MEYIFEILVLLVLLIVYLLYKLNKFDIEKEKKYYVGRIIHGDWQIDHYCQSCNFDYLMMIEGKLELSNEYKLKKEDKEQVTKILAEFKKDLSEKFFSARVALPKTKYYAINYYDFWMFSLYIFLDENTGGSLFCDEMMYKETITYKSYGYDSREYDATYSITDFAIIAFKLLYLSYMYCKNSKTLNPKGENFDNEQYIENIINTKKISIMHYKP